jgi:unsaturated chondroitin disaccharide hydrolase
LRVEDQKFTTDNHDVGFMIFCSFGHAYRLTGNRASAGALICSARIELSQYVSEEKAKEYLSVAETQIRTLSSTAYLANLGENGNFILKHSVGHMPNGTEIDVPLSYADYYYVEALMRMKKLLQG